MLKIGFASILFFFTYKSYSQQQGYLILIDAENSQPFYARVGDNIFPSSDIGHLIIPNLKDSTYVLAIGFRGNQHREQQFAVRTDKKDQGFQLRNQPEGWILYNWQTLESKMPLKKDTGGTGISVSKGIKKDDPFSRLMAAVVNDTAVLYNTYVEEKPVEDSLKREEANRPSVKTDTAFFAAENGKKPDAVNNEQATRVSMEIDSAIAMAEKTGKTNVRITKSPVKTDTTEKTDTLRAAVDPAVQKNAKNKMAAERPAIRKLSEKPLKFSLKLVYLDSSGSGPADTVAIYVPYETSISADSVKEKTQVNENKKPAVDDSTRGKLPDKKNKKPPLKQVAPAADSAKNGKLTTGKGKKAIAVSDCKNQASDYDADLLRIDILTANTIEDKIKAAGKIFKTKCFSITQIKTLSELFASDESKYKFYTAAYPFISDRNNFPQLLSQLSDEKYIKRFKQIGQ